MQLSLNTLVFALLVVRSTCLVTHQDEGNLRAARTLQDDDDLDPNPDVYIVELQAGITGVNQFAQQTAQNGNGKVGYVFQHALQGFVYHGSDIDMIKADPNVKSVTRDAISTMMGQSVPTGIQRIFADTKTYMQKASSSCRCDAVVAVIDTGVDFQHPDLRVNTAKSIDCTKGTTGQAKCVQGLGDDDNGHGTHVAGTIGAVNNNRGVVGVCPGAEIWAIKVLNRRGIGYNSWIIAGLEYVISQASKIDVANMSLGGTGCDATYCAVIDKAKRARVAFAVAAGNENKPASTSTPACCSAVLGKHIVMCRVAFKLVIRLFLINVFLSQLYRLCRTRTVKQEATDPALAVVAKMTRLLPLATMEMPSILRRPVVCLVVSGAQE